MKPFEPHTLPLESVDFGQLIRQIGLANRTLARYDGILQKLPNPDVLLSPLYTQEAVLSSKIEGTQATLEDVLQFEADPKPETPRYDDIKEIINYRMAMEDAIANLDKKPITLNLLKRMHFILMDSVRGKDKRRGEFRKIQNWIGSPGTPMEEATYVPPDPLNLLDHLSNWEKYIHYDEVDPLVQLAIIHAQFEIIHPFMDGNGRVGRMLLPLFLYSRGIIRKPAFYLSSYLESNRSEYYTRLQNISHSNQWVDWILFFLNAVIEQSRLNTDKANAILSLHEEMKITIRDLTHSQFAIQALDGLFNSPFFNTKKFASFSGIKKHNALRILEKLNNGQVIKTLIPKSGTRPAVYIFPRLLELVRT